MECRTGAFPTWTPPSGTADVEGRPGAGPGRRESASCRENGGKACPDRLIQPHPTNRPLLPCPRDNQGRIGRYRRQDETAAMSAAEKGRQRPQHDPDDLRIPHSVFRPGNGAAPATASPTCRPSKPPLALQRPDCASDRPGDRACRHRQPPSGGAQGGSDPLTFADSSATLTPRQRKGP